MSFASASVKKYNPVEGKPVEGKKLVKSTGGGGRGGGRGEVIFHQSAGGVGSKGRAVAKKVDTRPPFDFGALGPNDLMFFYFPTTDGKTVEGCWNKKDLERNIRKARVSLKNGQVTINVKQTRGSKNGHEEKTMNVLAYGWKLNTERWEKSLGGLNYEYRKYTGPVSPEFLRELPTYSQVGNVYDISYHFDCEVEGEDGSPSQETASFGTPVPKLSWTNKSTGEEMHLRTKEGKLVLKILSGIKDIKVLNKEKEAAKAAKMAERAALATSVAPWVRSPEEQSLDAEMAKLESEIKVLQDGISVSPALKESMQSRITEIQKRMGEIAEELSNLKASSSGDFVAATNTAKSTSDTPSGNGVSQTGRFASLDEEEELEELEVETARRISADPLPIAGEWQNALGNSKKDYPDGKESKEVDAEEVDSKEENNPEEENF